MKKCYPFLPKNWLRFGLAASFATTFSLNLLAQSAPVKQWEKVYGGSAGDSPNYLLKTTDSGYILGGWSQSGISGDKSQATFGTYDYWILKLDVNGNKQWEKSFGGSGQDILQKIVQTSDGGYIIGGHSSSGISSVKSQPSIGGEDYWVIKLDANGNKQWDKTFGGTSTDFLYGLQQTSDGGYLLGGPSWSGISGDKTQPKNGDADIWIVKLDANGNKIWDKAFGGNGTDYLINLKKTSDGGFVIGSSSSSGISGDKSQAHYGGSDFWILKLDANGIKQWDKTLGGNLQEFDPYVEQTSDGGYIVGGASKSGISGDKTQACQGDYDYWVIKLDGIGNKQWDKTYGGNGYEDLFVVHQVNGSGYILGGPSKSGATGNRSQLSNGGSDYWVVRLDASGNKIWDLALGGTLDDNLYEIQQTSDGGYILSGDSKSDISGNKTLPCKGLEDFWIIKLGPDVLGLKESEASFNLSISPNPNQGKFNLQLSNLTAPTAEVTVSDLLGRVVLQKEIQATNNQISKDLILPNAKGMYLLQLKTGKQIITRKIMAK